MQDFDSDHIYLCRALQDGTLAPHRLLTVCRHVARVIAQLPPEVVITAALRLIQLAKDAPRTAEMSHEITALLEELLNYEPKTTHCGRWAWIHYCLGDSLLTDVGTFAPEACRQRALSHLATGLELAERSDDEEVRADIHHRLGTALTGYGERATALSNLLEALEVYTRERNPKRWAAIQSDIGLLFLEGTDIEDAEYAIQHLQLAARAINKHEDIELWTAVQYRLGLAYDHRNQGSRMENRVIALGHYREAIGSVDRARNPALWASIRGDLGRALLRADQASEDQLDEAMSCVLDAQAIFTMATDPRTWSLLERAVARVYQRRNTGSRADNLMQADVHLRRALNIQRSIGDERLVSTTVRLLSTNTERRALLDRGAAEEEEV